MSLYKVLLLWLAASVVVCGLWGWWRSRQNQRRRWTDYQIGIGFGHGEEGPPGGKRERVWDELEREYFQRNTGNSGKADRERKKLRIVQ